MQNTAQFQEKQRGAATKENPNKERKTREKEKEKGVKGTASNILKKRPGGKLRQTQSIPKKKEDIREEQQEKESNRKANKKDTRTRTPRKQRNANNKRKSTR